MSNKVMLICSECDKPFEVWPSQAAKRKFCSHKCRVIGMHGVSRTKRPKPILICPECDEPFEVSSASVARIRKYCSLKCRGASRRNRVTVICQECDEPFEVTRYWAARRKFCSRKCSSLNLKAQNLKVLICAECDESFEVLPGSRAKFCSQDCNFKYRSRRTTLICERCDEPFEASLQRVNRKFCGKCAAQSYERSYKRKVTVTCQECDRSFEASTKRAKRCPDCRTKRITLICAECDEPFEVSPSLAGLKFCSRKCTGIFNRRTQVRLICPRCEKPFYVQPAKAAGRKFCSHACRGSYDLKTRGTAYQQVISATSPRLQLICKNCDEAFERTVQSTLRDFCSRACNAQWVEKETASRLTETVLLQAFAQHTSILQVATSLNALPDHVKIAVRLCGYGIVRKGTRSCIVLLEGERHEAEANTATIESPGSPGIVS